MHHWATLHNICKTTLTCRSSVSMNQDMEFHSDKCPVKFMLQASCIWEKAFGTTLFPQCRFGVLGDWSHGRLTCWPVKWLRSWWRVVHRPPCRAYSPAEAPPGDDHPPSQSPTNHPDSYTFSAKSTAHNQTFLLTRWQTAAHSFNVNGHSLLECVPFAKLLKDTNKCA